MKAYPEPEGGTKGSLLKRKDFIGVDHLANSHPNRTYYYRKNEDENDIINTCTRKLQVLFARLFPIFAAVLVADTTFVTVSSQNDPNNTKALFLRGSTYAKKSLYQDSISDFDALLRVDPSHADGLYCRGTYTVHLLVCTVNAFIYYLYFLRAYTHSDVPKQS